jgi:hypothetical protein
VPSADIFNLSDIGSQDVLCIERHLTAIGRNIQGIPIVGQQRHPIRVAVAGPRLLFSPARRDGGADHLEPQEKGQHGEGKIEQ